MAVNERVAGIVNAILDDYEKDRPIDRLEYLNIPDKEDMIRILNELVSICYYGYVRDRSYKIYNPKFGLATVIEDIIYRLERQIALVLPYDASLKDASEAEIQCRAQQITHTFMDRIPAVRAVLDTDLQALFDGDPAAETKDVIIFAYPGFYAITVYRIAHELVKLNVPMIPRIMSEEAHSRTGIDINPGAEIGEYFFIDHGTGIVIGETTVIGDHVKVYQGVTLGALSTNGGQQLRGVKRHPTIQDRVTIYSNASILGGIVIGSDCVIGGNVVITRDIPDGTRVRMAGQELSYRFADGTKTTS